jgi:DNA-binding NarL/FixJ family response regulator
MLVCWGERIFRPMSIAQPLPTRILLADSVQRVRAAVRELLEFQSDMQVVGEAADGSTTLALVEQLHPDLILLDVRLPDTDGLRLAAALHRAYPQLILVFYAANPPDGVSEAARQAGAVGFVEKGASPQTFLHTLRQAAAWPAQFGGNSQGPKGEHA